VRTVQDRFMSRQFRLV